MGRRSHTQSLHLWMNGVMVGTWSVQPRAGDILQYADAWVSADQGRPLSLSLPFTPGNPPHRGVAVRTYFENLLPDSRQIRERVARRFHATATDAFTLLAEVGRDCAGALQVLPDATPPQDARVLNATPLSEAEVAQVLRNTLAPTPFGGAGAADTDDFRISIAGAQEKTALLWFDGRWCLPHGATPTSHILKMPLGRVGNLQYDMSESVENEWLCSEILRAYGLPVARTQPLLFEDMKVLAVERFDRRWARRSTGQPWLLRLPQEDMCQATGTPPHLKYEADGGPGMGLIMRLLSTSLDPDRDRRIFFQAQVIFWMLRATDGHAKNFSIFLRPGGAYELAPLYDVLSAYPVMGARANQLSPFKARMAMAVRTRNPHWKMQDIQRRHWLALGAEHGVVTPDGRDARFVIDDLVARTEQVIRTVSELIPTGFPEALADSILGGLQAAAEKLAG
ncbi:type II toxin-antitoxin system HipA family toxin [Achromobacter xylosoxidans]|uniref:type II toxin-antitoxin system HipA family toxin n=1 Tax=Alcaligenes xylosoxydans xylosoxydans TaxID=85698 RepID=UPI000668D732|nr:type II toxin-antitoxin system HipA family toxin [Achromobacter xylosoxidans]MDC6163547.1 type II toxin-antitoxin system HipA family toxin [Achromobacter xylosoxidans]CUR66988.1 Serine/threonine-protein kinase HipA [Achromobacter xylosoxidans]CUR73250.1 Serine/threonine-protein kinase HipA [Achromobacter xylosoxidans]